MEVRKGLVYPH
jgi:hypothetical protein